MPRARHSHIIETLNPNLKAPHILRRSEQIGRLMTEVQRYYLDMGLVFADADAPAGAQENNELRVGKIAASGPINEGGLQFTVARCEEQEFSDATRPRLSEQVDGICGLVILDKRGPGGVKNPCQAEVHTPLELLEFDVREEERGNGLGKALLRYALANAHPEDPMVLDYVECNAPAQAMYERWGFEETGERFNHGIFATPGGVSVQNVAMQTTVGDLLNHLGAK